MNPIRCAFFFVGLLALGIGPASPGTKDYGSEQGRNATTKQILNVAKDGGPIAFYHFEGNADDASGHGNNGTVNGGVGYVTGEIGQAANFDGTSGYVSVSDNAGLRLATFTLAAWVYPTAVVGGNRIVEKGNSDSYWLDVNPDGKALVGFFDGTYQSVVAPQPLPLNSWSHVAGTYDGVTLKLYVNGLIVSTLSTTSSPSQTNEPLIIGWKFGGITDDHFAGAIDELRIYNYALGQTELEVTARSWLGGAVINNTLFAVGGGMCDTCSGFGGVEASLTEAFDSTSGAWYTKQSLQTARFGLASSAANGKLYAFGGVRGNQSLPEPTVEEYDPGADAWSVKTNMPTPRWKLTSSTVDGVIYTIGGGAGGNQCVPSAVVEAYDPAADAWIARKPMPTARWGAASAVLSGLLYVVGGSLECPKDQVIVSAELQAYDLISDSWIDLNAMSIPRWDLAAVAMNGKLYAIGGWDPVSEKALDAVEEFDPATNTWATKSPMPTPRSGLVAAAINGKIYAFGGNDGSAVLSILEIYDPSSNVWSSSSPPPPVNPPSITSVFPNAAVQNQIIRTFEVDGSNFTPDRATLSFSRKGVQVKDYETRTAVQIVARIIVSGNAPIGSRDVILTNSDGKTGVLLSGFTAFASAGFLDFPLPNRTPFTASINTVFDHSMTSTYCPDNVVMAFTNEVGLRRFGVSTFSVQYKSSCAYLHGFKNQSGRPFNINKQYAWTGEDKKFLYYDGHPGFDYRTRDQDPDNGRIPVLAAARGKVVCVHVPNSCADQTLMAPCTEGPGEVKIDHGNGYFSIYMHLSSSFVTKDQDVSPQEQIGVSGDTGLCGNPHLHFEIRKGIAGSQCSASNCFPVDPYGWWPGRGNDPYKNAGNVNLWK